MKGAILKGIQALAAEKLGVEGWERIKARAGCKEAFFVVGQDYPDQLVMDLIARASEESGLTPEEIMVEFGKHWISHTGKQSYPTMFQLVGNTAKQFLLSMDRVHGLVTRNIPGAKPPRFEYEELEDGRLRMHYRPERQLCPVLRGLILGVGIYFGEELEVLETRCMKKGDPMCTMEVSFP